MKYISYGSAAACANAKGSAKVIVMLVVVGSLLHRGRHSIFFAMNISTRQHGEEHHVEGKN